MAIIGCLILAAVLMLCLWVRLEAELEEIVHWMDNSIIEVEEGDYRVYFEESEYGWGNNVKNYMEENEENGRRNEEDNKKVGQD